MVLIIWKIHFQIWFKSGACFPPPKKSLKTPLLSLKMMIPTKKLSLTGVGHKKIRLQKKNVLVDK